MRYESSSNPINSQQQTSWKYRSHNRMIKDMKRLIKILRLVTFVAFAALNSLNLVIFRIIARNNPNPCRNSRITLFNSICQVFVIRLL